MAVDIKQLRIGAHVEVNGVRRAVFGLGCGRVSFLSHPVSSVAFSVLVTEVNPIPITPELLVELGFSEMTKIDCYREFGKEGLPYHISIYGDYVMASLPKSAYRSATFRVRSLHELEAFIFLTLGKELIEE